MTDTETTFMPPSDKALSTRPNGWLSKYQAKFGSCPVNMSFPIDPADVKLSTLRPAISAMNKGNKKFKVVDHKTTYEIYRKE